MEMQENQDKGHRMYVGNLEYSVSDEELEQFMHDKGVNAKNVRVVRDRLTGRSKGFGFADVDNEEELNTAISNLDGQELKGRKMRVDKAQERRARSSFNRGPRRPGRFGGFNR